MNYAHFYNLNQKAKSRKLKRKEIILALLIFIGLFSTLGLAGKIEILSMIHPLVHP